MFQVAQSVWRQRVFRDNSSVMMPSVSLLGPVALGTCCQRLWVLMALDTWLTV